MATDLEESIKVSRKASIELAITNWTKLKMCMDYDIFWVISIRAGVLTLLATRKPFNCKINPTDPLCID